MKYSMRRRILIALVLALAVIMITAGVISYRVALHEADEIFSARLATSARVLETLLARQVEHATIDQPVVISLPAELSEADPDEPTELGHPYETKLAFQVWSDTGRLLVRSEFAPEDRLGPLKEGFWDRDSGGVSWHVFTLKSGGVWIEVAEEVGLRGEIASDVGGTLITPLLTGFALLMLLVNLIVIVGFRPLAKLAESIEHRDPKDNSPLDLNNTPEELLPVVNSLNSLLNRMSETLAREQRFTDSAAHELRTPLAAMSVHAENAANAKDEDERAISLAYLMTGMNRTKHLIEQMLMYSRIGVDAQSEPEVPVDLIEELQYLVNSQRTIIEGSGLQVQLNTPTRPVWVKSQRGLLEMLLRNLLDNACKHSTKQDVPVSIELTVELPSNKACIRFRNMAEPIASEEISRLFEAYYRPANTRSKGHGLGLAIAREVAVLHGWSLELTRNSAREGIEFTCKIPAINPIS
ncbi:MAG: sensor histidine kinase N-terminal domain-containing protein [Gammaproteobacteria bacterium]|nr:ATP-binding protein [uncultured Limnobacter sp.]MBU0542309.1 sensor histidine kinase N-terminal domain-containing protein [Gammaproteobacteria bacterium]